VTLTRPDGPDLLGTAVAVDDDGRLVVEGADGRHAWAAGDVTHLRSAR
jgi:BirA family biotin operon repressor/biotin-[acetyl-CoA-carboxylase] ligase